MDATPWVYEHMVQSPYDKKPYSSPLYFATREAAERRRDACLDGGCSGSCRRAGAGAGKIKRR